jgi:uncharacterized protein GlcG (DUF336 family)
MKRLCLLAVLSLAVAPYAFADSIPVTHMVKQLSPEAALIVAKAALENCRKSGFQVAVSVVDRSGIVLVVLRDRYAGPHTPDTATGKAWTAVSFRTPTTELAKSTQPGQPMSAIRQLPRVVALGGGLQIEADGSLVGGVGVSGGPGGEADEKCATAGIDAIRDELAF